jgi:methyl-accepting chemotaxis protein
VTSTDSSLSESLKEQAEKLHYIQKSLESLAETAGDHSKTVSHVLATVRSAAAIARSASRVINLREHRERQSTFPRVTKT